MLDYTSTYLKIFPWAKAAYDYTSGLPINAIGSDGLVNSITTDLNTYPVSINTSMDWNYYSNLHTGVIAGMYATVDSLENYYNNLYNDVFNRINEAENRVAELESNLKVSRTVLTSETTSSLTIRGGQTDWIETNPSYYKNYGRLAVNPEEKIFV